VPPHAGVSFHIRVGIYNQGNAAAGAFTVQWWLTTSGAGPTCTWNVASMAAHGGRILECDYTPGGWNNAYPSRVVADAGNNVIESNEGNNTLSQALQIAP
jgi:subtilase family serine protease